MSLIDTHCHLTFDALYRDLDGVLRRAWRAGVRRIITIATDATDSRRTVAVADHYHGVHATIGIHPHHAAAVGEDAWRCLRELRHNPNVVAWGEIGLDYHYQFAGRDQQQKVFAQQLLFAHRARLPVVIHCREAVADVVSILRDHDYAGRRVVFHCFSGTPEDAQRIMDHGWWLSFTGMVTFKNSRDLQQVAAGYPLEQLMLETDAPYLSPEPHRKIKPNEPALLPHTARFFADLKGLPVDELIHITTSNAARFFGLNRQAMK